MSTNLIQSIKTNYAHFSKGQKRIADYMINNYDKAAFMTAAKMGKMTNVSESTVVRFATVLGFDGYPEMQKVLQESVRSRLTSLQRIQANEDQLLDKDLITTIMHRDIACMEDAINNINRDEFDKFVNKLLVANHIYILGVRSSSFLAGYLNFYFHLLLNNAIFVQNTAGGEIYEQLIHVSNGDVVIAITFPRYSQMVLDAASFASERGAEILAITDSPNSPVYRDSFASLFVHSDAISFVDSMSAPMSLINAIIVAVGRKKPNEVSSVFSEIEQVWKKHSIFDKGENE